MVLVEAGSSGVTGTLNFRQDAGSSTVRFTGTILNLAAGEHGIHVHMTGNLGNNCADAGGHFNPFGQTHGGPADAVRHVGDLGNILSTGGTTEFTINDNVISLDPNSQANIRGRAVVVHAGRDDLGRGGNAGSLTTGNAGGRLACGIIV